MTDPMYNLSFQLEQNDFNLVAALAVERGVSIGDLVRSALSMHFFLSAVQDKGGKVVVEKNDGSMLCLMV